MYSQPKPTPCTAPCAAQEPVRIVAGPLGATLMVWGADAASMMTRLAPVVEEA